MSSSSSWYHINRVTLWLVTCIACNNLSAINTSPGSRCSWDVLVNTHMERHFLSQLTVDKFLLSASTRVPFNNYFSFQAARPGYLERAIYDTDTNSSPHRKTRSFYCLEISEHLRENEEHSNKFRLFSYLWKHVRCVQSLKLFTFRK